LRKINIYLSCAASDALLDPLSSGRQQQDARTGHQVMVNTTLFTIDMRAGGQAAGAGASIATDATREVRELR
jgi:hypothetical protein